MPCPFRQRLRALAALIPEGHEQTFVVRLKDNAPKVLQQARPERAVGVVFQPEHERAGNYLDARMAEQFDAVIHVDRSTRVLPLKR